MVCLDTSFLIALIRRDHEAEKKLEAYLAAEAELSTTPITACELFKGAYRSGRNENVTRVRKSLAYLQILDFSIDACERYGKLVNELHLKGTPIGDADTMIASIALTCGEILLTSDMEHFGRVPGLTIETW
jgi:tRNA(fMet)-specific endonuclease VapC